MEPIKKLEGTTPSERYLKALCEKSFLSLWSYPNVFRDQGQKAGKGDGKEVCDLLVAFGRDVIVFSDKSCAFPDTGDINVDWARWHKRAIEKSVAQVYGAERWIREHPDRLFLDAECSVRFPIEFGRANDLRFHRVVVALGAGERCRKHYGGSGSLILLSTAFGVPETRPENFQSGPFMVMAHEHTKGFVHVFDDVTLDIVLKEMDTAQDFVSYLRSKEEFMTGPRLVFSSGEENLLAYFIRHLGDDGDPVKLTFPDEFRFLLVGEDLWQGLLRDPVYLRWKAANAPSYAWDKIIEIFNENILSGTMRTALGQDEGLGGHERRVRALARPRRFVRRSLALALAQLFQASPTDVARFRAVIPEGQKDTGYIFLLVPRARDEPVDVYREGRGNMLLSYAMVFKWKHPELKHVVGFATGPRDATEGSEEIVYIDGADWGPEDDVQAERIQNEHGLMTDMSVLETSFGLSVDTLQGNDLTSHRRHRDDRKEKQQRRATRKAQRAARKKG